MDIKLIGSLIGYDVEGEYPHYELQDGFLISRDQQFLNENFLNDYFVKRVGELDAESLQRYMYVYFIVNTNEIPKEVQSINIPAMFSSSIGMLNAWLLSLWLVKDNSVSMRNIYLYTEDDTDQAVASRTLQDVCLNALGEQSVTIFTEEEFDEAINWLNILKPYLSGKNRESEELKEGLVKDDSHDIYMKNDRFLRALRFIFLARSQSFIPERITSFVSAMETLLSTSNAELKFQVSSRACKILGGELEERKRNYDIVREAYDLRSSYVHGSELYKKYRSDNGKLDNLAKNVDNLMRELIRVLLEKHSDLAGMSNDQLNDWFTNLILE